MTITRGKKNRGETTKLSIKLSAIAHDRLELISRNIGATRSQIVTYILSMVRRQLPRMDEIRNLQNDITLEKNHFVLSITKELGNQLQQEALNYNSKKNTFFGLLVSQYLGKMNVKEPWLKSSSALEIQQEPYKIYFHNSYAHELDQYSIENYVQLKVPIALSLLQGTTNLQQDEFSTYVGTSTTLPLCIISHVRKQAKLLDVPEYVYVDSCIREFLENIKKQV